MDTISGIAEISANVEIAEVLCAQFIAHVTLADRARVRYGRPLVKIWLVRNSGRGAWPIDTEVVFIDGNMRGVEASFKVPALQPNEDGEVMCTLIPPAADAMSSPKTTSVWRLRSSAAASNGDNGLFGPTLMCDVVTIDDMDTSQIDDSNGDTFTDTGNDASPTSETLNLEMNDDCDGVVVVSKKSTGFVPDLHSNGNADASSHNDNMFGLEDPIYLSPSNVAILNGAPRSSPAPVPTLASATTVSSLSRQTTVPGYTPPIPQPQSGTNSIRENSAGKFSVPQFSPPVRYPHPVSNQNNSFSPSQPAAQPYYPALFQQHTPAFPQVPSSQPPQPYNFQHQHASMPSQHYFHQQHASMPPSQPPQSYNSLLTQSPCYIMGDTNPARVMPSVPVGIQRAAPQPSLSPDETTLMAMGFNDTDLNRSLFRDGKNLEEVVAMLLEFNNK